MFKGYVFEFPSPSDVNCCDNCFDSGVYLFPIIVQRIILKREYDNREVYDQELVTRFICKNCLDSITS